VPMRVMGDGIVVIVFGFITCSFTWVERYAFLSDVAYFGRLAGLGCW